MVGLTFAFYNGSILYASLKIRNTLWGTLPLTRKKVKSSSTLVNRKTVLILQRIKGPSTVKKVVEMLPAHQ